MLVGEAVVLISLLTSLLLECVEVAVLAGQLLDLELKLLNPGLSLSVVTTLAGDLGLECSVGFLNVNEVEDNVKYTGKEEAEEQGGTGEVDCESAMLASGAYGCAERRTCERC